MRINWNETNIERSIKVFMENNNIDRMPTHEELRNNGFSGLSVAIYKYGGTEFWKEKLNLNPKEKEILWTNEKIKSEIFESINSLSIERMPTGEELKSLGKNSLHSAICKSKKFSGWANELGLELKSCDTRFGQKYEDIAKTKLENLGFTIERMTTKYPYDLLVNGCVKVDVKVAKPYMLRGESRVHTFNLQKPNATCDIYICILLDEEEKEERIFIIPSHLVKIKTLCVGKDSSYNRFNNAWQFIEEYSQFFKGVAI